ncbi:MAG: zf-HC2 domain-containing protein [Ignavibacteriae bacterium]|nr:zf-HC2 domain-containing protein [Ignavibacteriota bacterium]
MNHLSRQQVFALIDGQLDDAEERTCNAHLAGCARCRNEVALQRSLDTAVENLPLERTSSWFTERTMNRILRAGKQSLSYRILQHVGSAVAMVAVLVVLGYILSSPSELLVGNDDSASSSLFSSWKTFYNNVSAAVSQNATRLNNVFAGQTATPVTKIIATTLLVLVVLAGLDRYVFRKVVRMKI